MAESADLAALVEHPFALLQEMERRSRAAHAGQGAGSAPAEWVGVGFRIGEEQFVAPREQVREVLMLPDTMTRVPGAQRWMLGIANLRGHLLPLVDTLNRLHRDKSIAFRQLTGQTGTLPMEQQDGMELLGNLLDNACKWARGRVELDVAVGHDIDFTVADDRRAGIDRYGRLVDKCFDP